MIKIQKHSVNFTNTKMATINKTSKNEEKVVEEEV